MYFPNRIWYDLINGVECVNCGGNWMSVNAPIDHIPVYISGN
jgi:alpha-glucosidase (family GH31 glycosyl hydrolase)